MSYIRYGEGQPGGYRTGSSQILGGLTPSAGGPQTHFGAADLTITVAEDTSATSYGRRPAKQAVKAFSYEQRVLPSRIYRRNPVAKVTGQIADTYTVGIVTNGVRKVLGAAADTYNVNIVTAAIGKKVGAAADTYSFGISVSAIANHKASVTNPITVDISVTGVAQAKPVIKRAIQAHSYQQRVLPSRVMRRHAVAKITGQIADSYQVGIFVNAIREAPGGFADSYTLSISTAAIRKALGSVTDPITFGISTDATVTPGAPPGKAVVYQGKLQQPADQLQQQSRILGAQVPDEAYFTGSTGEPIFFTWSTTANSFTPGVSVTRIGVARPGQTNQGYYVKPEPAHTPTQHQLGSRDLFFLHSAPPIFFAIHAGQSNQSWQVRPIPRPAIPERKLGSVPYGVLNRQTGPFTWLGDLQFPLTVTASVGNKLYARAGVTNTVFFGASTEALGGTPIATEEYVGPETTHTWRDLLRESMDPGDPDVVSGADRWGSAR